MRVSLRTFLVLLSFLVAFAMTCSAQVLYVTSEPNLELLKVDMSTGVQQVLYNVGAKPDSLIINSQGQIIYSVSPAGYVALFDPSTGSNTILVSGLPSPRDLVIEPSGTTMLIALNSQGKIARYNFVTGVTTQLGAKFGSSTDGLAYDPAGHLFAVISHNTIVQIDPVTGAKVKTLVLVPHNGVDGGDGMTYDPYTGELWVSCDGKASISNGLVEVPTDLSGYTPYQTGNIKVPDGLVPDGNGNLYIGAGLWRVVVYNIPTDTITRSLVVKGVDDVALVPGTF